MKRLTKALAGVGLAALAVVAIAPAAQADNHEINAYLLQADGDLGDRYVEPGEVTRVVLALRSGGGTVPANSVRGAWIVSGGAIWVNAQVAEANSVGANNHTFQLHSPTHIQADGPSGPTSGFNGAVVESAPGVTYRNYYANLQIPADAQPGDQYVTTTAIGTSQTGYTNVGSPTTHVTTLTVRAPDVTADTPSTGSTVETRQPVIEGTGQPGQTVTLSIGGSEVGSGTVGPDGTWSAQVLSTLADGPHTVTVTQIDSTGYTSTDTVSFIIAEDAEVPVIDPIVAGGAGMVLLAGAGAYLLARRRRSLTG